MPEKFLTMIPDHNILIETLETPTNSEKTRFLKVTTLMKGRNLISLKIFLKSK